MEILKNPPPNNSAIPTLPKRSYLPIIRQFHPSSVSNDPQLDKLVKMNSNDIAKFKVGNLLPFGPNFFFEVGDPIVQGSNRKKKLKHIARLKNIANLLQHKKIVPSLDYNFQPCNSNEMDFIISKLKALHYSTSSLDLDLSSVSFCTPQHLKNLSIILSHFKKLTSLTIVFPNEIKNSKQLLSAFFFALSRLKSLHCLNLNFHHMKITYAAILERCLSKVLHLKSLALTMIDCGRIGAVTLLFLPTTLKKLSFLQSLHLDILDSGDIPAKTFQTFLKELQDLKSLKNLYLGAEEPRSPFSLIPLKKGSAKIDPSSSQEKSWKIKYSPVQYNDNLEHLAEALQISPLIRELNLDFSHSYSLTDNSLSQICSSIQNLQSLTSLQLNFSETKKISCLAKMLGSALKSLVKLRSFDLNFNGITAIDDDQIASFTESLQDLSEMRSLKLNLSKLEKLTNRGIESLSSAIGKLTKLEELSLTLAGNVNYNKQGLDILAKALEKLVSLAAITLHVKDCYHLKGEENFEEVYKALDKLECLKSRTIKIPQIMEDHEEFSFNRNFEQQIIWD